LLGDGMVEGTLFDRTGKPITDRVLHLTYVGTIDRAAATLAGKPRPPRSAEMLETKTADDGAFRFTRVPSGRWDLEGALEERLGKGLDSRRASFALLPKETKRIDLGTSTSEPLWTGVIRFSSGTPVRGFPRLFLADAAHGTQIWTKIDENGRVSQRAPPGSYALTLADERGNAIPAPLPAVSVGEQDAIGDVLVPGVRVQGAVRFVKDGVAVAWPAQRGLVVSARLTSARVPADVIALVRANAEFEFLGLAFGRWRVSVQESTPGAPPLDLERDVDVTDRDIEGLVFELRAP
jgi:hypothetical protein